jgi:hypothetical protein
MMPALKLITAQNHRSFSWRKPWLYVYAFGIVGLLSLSNFILLPLVAKSSIVPIDPTVPQAEPGIATSNLLASFNAQKPTARPLDFVTHSYLTGQGVIFGLAGDNIQIFEYPNADIARKEALAVFKQVPWLVSKNYFHIFQSGSLIGLYIGDNPAVLQLTEREMGAPLANPDVTQ